MSFYGNLKRVNSGPFVFDKIYPNRVAMENAIQDTDIESNAVKTDDVYIGRYVLINYGIDPVSGVWQGKSEPDGNNGYQRTETYNTNFQTDANRYHESFDSTVWQKIYTTITRDSDNSKKPVEKYIMVAELNAAVPHVDLDVISPKRYKNNIEVWNEPSVKEEATSENIMTLEMPNVLSLEVPEMEEDFYGKGLTDPRVREDFKTYIESIYQNINVGADDTGFEEQYNYIDWKNIYYTGEVDNQGKKIYDYSAKEADDPIDGKELDIKLYAVGRLISDLYDALYGIPDTTNHTGQRPFFINNVSEVLGKNEKGLIGILSSIATDAKGDFTQDTGGRIMQEGQYYYFITRWCDAAEDPDKFIENIPKVIGAINTPNNSHYKIDFNDTNGDYIKLQQS